MSAFCCWILAGVALVGADPVLGAELSAAAPSPVMVEDAAPLEGVVLERGRERTAEEIAESYRGFLTPRPPKTVGFVLDGPPAQEDPVDRYAAEIMEVAGKSFDIRFVRRAADQTVAGVDAALHEMLADPGVDLLITTGTLGSFRALRAGAPPKPVIAGMLLEPAVAGLTLSKDGGSGVKNLACAAFEGVVPRDLARFRELSPFKRVAVLVDARLAEAAPDLAADLSRLLEGMDLAVSVVPVGADAAAAVAAIPADAEAVYFAPLPGHTPEGVEALARGVNERRLPSFSLNGPADVRAGVLATLQTENETRRIGRRLANHTYRILSGDAPEILPAAMTAAENFLVNLETARGLGLVLPWETLVQAETINDDPAQVDARFTLEQAVRTALEANLDLDEKERQVRAGAQNIPAARANLLPQVSAGGTYVSMDKEMSSAVQPQRTLTGAITVTQLIYDEMAHANVEIQKRLQAALEQEQAGLELDVAKLAADAYLNVLRAKTYEGIQKGNLRRTLENRRLAVLRRDAGIAGPAEGYRWDAEAAQNRIEVVKAGSMRRAAEIQFNRVLNRDQEALFAVEEVNVDDALLLSCDADFAPLLADTARAGEVRAFLVRRGLEEAPELRQLDEAVKAQGRFYTATLRKYYLPTVGLQWETKHKFGAWGEGAQGGFQTMVVPGMPDYSWTVGVNASLPLYAGGKRKAERIQARETVEQLKLKRTAVAQKLEQRIRTAAQMAGASRISIGQARQAAEAARKGLELVSDGYGRGVLKITDLVDAQTAALVSDLAAAGAVYQHLLDMMELYRAVAVIPFLETPENRASFAAALDAYLAEKGLAPAPEK